MIEGYQTETARVFSIFLCIWNENETFNIDAKLKTVYLQTSLSDLMKRKTP